MDRQRSAEETQKAVLAVGLVVLFLERALVELSLAVRADKVLWVVLAVHGCHAAPSHRLVAGHTQRAAPSVEVRLAVRHTFMVVETLGAKRTPTLLHKRIHTPCRCRAISTAVATAGIRFWACPSTQGGSVAKWLACWIQAQKDLGSNRSRHAVG